VEVEVEVCLMELQALQQGHIMQAATAVSTLITTLIVTLLTTAAIVTVIVVLTVVWYSLEVIMKEEETAYTALAIQAQQWVTSPTPCSSSALS
jgi:hypothetical protein